MNKNKEDNIKNNQKKSVLTVDILGVNIAAINMEWLIEFTEKNIKELSGKYFCVTNVHCVVTASENEEYKKIQNNAVLAMPDGAPLSFIGGKKGFSDMQRTTGPDYMEEIFKISAKHGYKHFFYGSTDDTLKKLEAKLKNKYEELKIVGMYSPPFRELTLEEDAEIINLINKSNPDFIWVGLGAPKQETWMYNHQNKVNGLMVGVGAGFDYFAGNIKRAPMWMQKCSLEWLYRLIQDPKRLFKRYIITNTKFLFKILFNKD